MSLNQYSFVFRVSLQMPVYLLPLNYSIEKWMNIINATITPKKRIVNVITVPQFSKQIQLVRETILNLKLNKFIARMLSVSTKAKTINNNTVIDFEFVKYFAETRSKTAIRRQISILQSIIAEVVDVTKQKAFIIAFNPFEVVQDKHTIKPYAQTLFYGLYKYGNTIFDLFDVVLLLYYTTETKSRYYVIKSEFKQSIDLNKVNAIFRKLYSQYLQHNDILHEDELLANQMLEDVEAEQQTDENIPKQTLSINKLYKKIDVDKDVEVINTKDSTELITQNYTYEIVKLSKPVQLVVKDKIPKPIHRQIEHDLLPHILAKIIELKGFKVLNVEVKFNKNINSTKDTLVKTYIFEIQLPNGTKDKLEVNIPLLVDQYYYYIGGTKKILIQQIINKPIVYIGNYTTLILTHRQTMRVQYKTTRGNIKTFEWYVVGLRVNPIIPFTVHNRLENFAKVFGFDVKIE